MRKQAFNSWVTSFSLHVIFIAAIAITWKPQIISEPDPSISVDIIDTKASNIGPSHIQDEAPTATNETSIAPENNIEPPPTPSEITEAAPEPPKQNAFEALKAILPQAKPQMPPTTTQKPSAQQQKPIQPASKTINSTAKPAPKNNANELDFQFDIPAATQNSSGVNSGGRAPKLSNGSKSTSGKTQGGGKKLNASLEGLLRDQVKLCWAEPADLSDPKSLLVEYEIFLSPNGQLTRPPKLIYPATKTGASSSTLVAIDNALRATKQCAPYVLPPEDYADWQHFTFRFDPKKLRH